MPVLRVRGGVLDSALLCFVPAVFWGMKSREALSMDVMYRSRFWSRVWIQLVLPLLGLLPIILVVEGTGSAPLRAFVHLALAGMGASALHAVVHEPPAPGGIHERSAANPF